MRLNQNPQVKILVAKQLSRNRCAELSLLGTATRSSVLAALAPSWQSLWQGPSRLCFSSVPRSGTHPQSPLGQHPDT